MKKVYIFVVCIFLLIQTTDVKADNIIHRPKLLPINNVYTEGFYSFNIDGTVKLSVELITDKPTSIMLLNKEQNIQFITNLPYKNEFQLVNITSDKIIGIVGDGEVVLTFIKN